MAVEMVERGRRLDQEWSSLHFGDVAVDTVDGQHVFTAQVHLGGLSPEAVRVELFGNAFADGSPVRQAMEPIHQIVADATGGYVYQAAVSSARPSSDYTARIVPLGEGTAVPLEDARVVWQR